MRYWGFLLAKLATGTAVAWAVWVALNRFYHPKPLVLLDYSNQPFAHDLTWTSLVLLYWLFCNGLLYLIILDQRYRCRTCLRRLRMPILTGSWPNMLLLGKPRTEYICPYGHGTLRVPEVHITGIEPIDWEEHEDYWTELTRK